MTGRFWISLGALVAGCAVAAGAMGAHYLKETLHWPEADLATFETAVRYQMYHSGGLALAGILLSRGNSRLISAAAWLFLVGLLLFSGGLYAWLGTGIKPFVHVVPIGGSLWIVAWLLLAMGARSWPNLATETPRP